MKVTVYIWFVQISSACSEAQQLRDENESLAAQVTASMERPATEGRENGDVAYNENKHIDTNSDKCVSLITFFVVGGMRGG